MMLATSTVEATAPVRFAASVEATAPVRLAASVEATALRAAAAVEAALEPRMMRRFGTSRAVASVWKGHRRFTRKHVCAATTHADERRNEGHCDEGSESNVLNQHGSAQRVAINCVSRVNARGHIGSTACRAQPSSRNDTVRRHAVPRNGGEGLGVRAHETRGSTIPRHARW